MFISCHVGTTPNIVTDIYLPTVQGGGVCLHPHLRVINEPYQKSHGLTCGSLTGQSFANLSSHQIRDPGDGGESKQIRF